MQLAWLNEDSEEREEAHIIQYSKTKVVKMGKLFELSCQNSLKLFSLLIAMHDLNRAIKKYINDPLAKMIISKKIIDGNINISVENEKLNFGL